MHVYQISIKPVSQKRQMKNNTDQENIGENHKLTIKRSGEEQITIGQQRLKNNRISLYQ